MPTKVLKLCAMTMLLVLATACSPTGPVARVSEVDIPREEYNRELQRELDYYEGQGIVLSDQEQEMVKTMVIDRLINNVLLEEAAVAQGITRESLAEEIDVEYAWIQLNYIDETGFLAALENSGYTADSFREAMAQVTLIDAFFETVLDYSAVVVDPEHVQTMVDMYLGLYDEEELDVEELRYYCEDSIRQNLLENLRQEYIDGLREETVIEYLDY